MPSQSGFTFAEVLIMVAAIAIGTGAAVPGLNGRAEEARIARASSDIVQMEAQIERYREQHNALPESLEILGTVAQDPWGHAYEYVNFATRGLSEQRAYHNLPLNSDYDLYSRGVDGQSDLMIDAEPAHDDIVRARDGEFVGRATEF